MLTDHTIAASSRRVSGFVALVRAPEALASIITEVLDDPARAAAVGQAGRAAAVKLSGERNARLTCGVYGKALTAAS